MAHTPGRAPRGQHLGTAIPLSHWNTTTFVVGLRNNGFVRRLSLTGRSITAFPRPASPGFSYPSSAPRHRDHGQPGQPRGSARLQTGRGDRCEPALSPAPLDFTPSRTRSSNSTRSSEKQPGGPSLHSGDRISIVLDATRPQVVRRFDCWHPSFSCCNLRRQDSEDLW
jgi:hypothetical protein